MSQDKKNFKKYLQNCLITKQYKNVIFNLTDSQYHILKTCLDEERAKKYKDRIITQLVTKNVENYFAEELGLILNNRIEGKEYSFDLVYPSQFEMNSIFFDVKFRLSKLKSQEEYVTLYFRELDEYNAAVQHNKHIKDNQILEENVHNVIYLICYNYDNIHKGIACISTLDHLKNRELETIHFINPKTSKKEGYDVLIKDCWTLEELKSKFGSEIF